jgi:hypothetical protein
MMDHQGNTSELELIKQKRDHTRARHAAALGTLMTQRDDLRGVYAFADYLDDAVRWSA